MNKTNRARDSRENAKWYHRSEVEKAKTPTCVERNANDSRAGQEQKHIPVPGMSQRETSQKRAPETDEMIRADSVGMGCLMPLVGREGGIKNRKRANPVPKPNALKMHPTCMGKRLNLAEGENEEDASPALANRQQLLDVRREQKQNKTKHKLFRKPVDANTQIGVNL